MFPFENFCNVLWLCGGIVNLGTKRFEALLTWPLTRGFLLLVSFNLSKAITPWAIHSWPVAGESGWTYKLWGSGGSPEPATIHWELEHGGEHYHQYATLICTNLLINNIFKWTLFHRPLTPSGRPSYYIRNALRKPTCSTEITNSTERSLFFLASLHFRKWSSISLPLYENRKHITTQNFTYSLR